MRRDDARAVGWASAARRTLLRAGGRAGVALGIGLGFGIGIGIGLGILPAAPPAVAEAVFYREAPDLAARAARGELPPLQWRLPRNPLLIPVEEAGRYGGTWRLGLIGAADGLLVYRTIGYEPLVRWDPAWRRVIPNVAQSFQVSDDATRFTFRLRPGLRWSDGEPFTAEDIRFWFEHVLLDPELTPSPPVWMPNAPRAVRLEVDDPYTVRFVFPEPNGLFLVALASASDLAASVSHPRHALARYHRRLNPDGIAVEVRAAGAADWVELFRLKAASALNRSDPAALLRDPPGPAGARQAAARIPTLNAWVIDRLEPGDPPRFVAERNPYYWKVDPVGQQLPYIDRTEFMAVETLDRFVGLLADGRIDLQSRHLGHPALQARLGPLLEKGYRGIAMQPADSNAVPLVLNLTHPEPALRALFADRRFRVALSRAIDRRAVVDNVFGGQGEPQQVAPRPDSRFHLERLARQHLDHDLAAADLALDLLGLERRDGDGVRLMADGRRLSFTMLVRQDRPHQGEAMALIAAGWRRIGVEARVEVVSRRALEQRVAENRFDGLVGQGDGGMEAIQEAHAFIPALAGSQAAPLWTSWARNPGAPGAVTPPPAVLAQMELFHQLKRTTAPDLQERLMRAILEIAADQFFVIGICTQPGYTALARREFRNVPRTMPDGWAYPTPAPTNPSQYFLAPPPSGAGG